jgi:hypothetical protein
MAERRDHLIALQTPAMKSKFFPRPSDRRNRSGFALVITLTLMVLLTLVAVGLLTLSSITLRASGQGEAMAVARANARLALMLALGDLQKHAGPDKIVTAPCEIVRDKPNMPRLTGAWDSWDAITPGGTASPDYDGKKRDLFRAWLVSDSDPKAVRQRDYDGSKGETIRLVGPGTLGTGSPDPADMIMAGKVPVSRDGKPGGSYAWHVSDESFKARINAYRDPTQAQDPWRKSALLAGHRPDASVVSAADGSKLSFLPGDADAKEFETSRGQSGKLTGLDQFELLPDGKPMGPFRHHVTPYSFGLLTNVREGGLKQDLTSMFETSPTALPKPYDAATARLYQSTHKITGTSDPYWTTLKGYYDVYKEASMKSATPIYYKAPQESVSLAAVGQTAVVPKKFYPAPVIARVEMLFSVVVRESHGPWSAASTKLTEHTRMVHLLYAPIVTLHNPYNVSLKFDKLDLDINGIPIALNFVVNGEAQNRAPVSYNRMYVNLADRTAKAFMLTISNWSDFGSSSPSPITMRPGQSLVCGPYIDGNTVFGGSGGEGSRVFFDYSNNLTGDSNARAKCRPGFLGKQVSFDIDWITPDNGPFSTDGNRGVLIVKPTDRFFIEFKMKPNSNDNGTATTDKMTVAAKLTSQGREMEIGGLQFDYDVASIDKRYPTLYRYPDARSVPSDLLVENLWEPNLTPIKDHAKVKSFALLSFRARTANGGVYDTGSRDKLANGENLLNDGRLAGIPLLHHNPARTPTVVDLKRDLPGRYSHELNLEPLKGTVDDIFDIDASNRGYLLTANKKLQGIKSGSYLELPTGPMQTIADFRRSNALTSSQLPNFVQPVANSYPSPLIAPDKFLQSGVVSYPLLDHSVLANHALYDRFYFSTFATYDSSNTPDKVFTGFMDGSKPLAAQSFEPYLPEGKTVDAAKGELFSGGKPTATAYQQAAEYQLVRSPFNVNSMDIQAWKAVLSATSGDTVQLLWATSAARGEKTSNATPLPPMSIVNGGAVGKFDGNNDISKIDNALTNDFNGHHQLTSDQVDQLAAEIVEEVRKRGPFLSMSEFVNRQIRASSGQPMAGALQTAIDEARINDPFLAGSAIPVRDTDVADGDIYGFPNPKASLGNPAAGAPGWLNQGDLMRVLEPGATVRGDTFVIRTCGEAFDVDGKVVARAYAEAVVQRVPEYINSADRPSVNVWDPSVATGAADNKRFGRRLNIVSFRWLSPQEI